jgi:hypothetical protein
MVKRRKALLYSNAPYYMTSDCTVVHSNVIQLHWGRGVIQLLISSERGGGGVNGTALYYAALNFSVVHVT